MPRGDNPHSVSENTAALRESPKQPKNVVNEQPTTSPFPENKVAATVGIKRPQPYGPLSPTNHHTLGNPGANGHLVYVRRRLETDQSKGGTAAHGESASSTSLKKACAGSLQSQGRILKHQNNATHTQCAPRFASPAAATPSPALHPAVLSPNCSFGKQSPGKVAAQPANDVTTSLPHSSNVVSSAAVLQSSVSASLAPSSVSAANTASRAAISATNLASCSALGTNASSNDATTTLASNQAHPPRSSNQDRSERFLRLQEFLRHNEQSDQEEYVHKLRSLSPVGRSKHAFELEKRAANLLIEEGKELQKMKFLNVLGKLVPPITSESAPFCHASAVVHCPSMRRV
ncbi:hypothetical protein Zm00014a_038155 [Zea mays]|uniref:Uncharacterized protein n=1 Tax=Zea mays TaxID=4577 RepID=A0A3L6FYX5_MAIZE|nr:hypothetical protein Zm00014a_038155 [Zea mays]